MSFFINLPLRYAANDRKYIDFALRHKLWPEIGIDAWSMQQLPQSWHRRLADELQRAGLSCSAHLPFFDLRPGSLDNGILSATRKRLNEAVELCKIYQPRLMIAHPSFDPWQHLDHFPEWLERSATTWEEALSVWPDGPPLYLENVHERDPSPLLELVRHLDNQRIAVCLDIGHWFSYARGSEKNNLDFWLSSMKPYLRHLHLHDNNGNDDEHLGLGQGKIPLAEFFTLLESYGLTPTFTLEPHSLEDCEHSREYITDNTAFFKRLFIRR